MNRKQDYVELFETHCIDDLFDIADGDEDLLTLLLLHISDQDDCDYMSFASEDECLAMFEKLLNLGANVTGINPYSAASVLQNKNMTDRLLNLLLSRGAESAIGHRDINRQTSLMHCRKLSIAEMLIDLGEDVDAYDKFNKCALHYFLNHQQPDLKMIKLLINSHMDIDKFNETQLVIRNPYHFMIGLDDKISDYLRSVGIFLP